jgi:aminopeptidase
MRDPRVTELARTLVRHSVDVRPGENVLVELLGDERPLAEAVVEEVYAAGGVPFVQVRDQRLLRVLLGGATAAQLDAMASWDLARSQAMHAVVAIRGGDNDSELAGVDPARMKLYMTHYRKPVVDHQVSHTKWVYLRYPTPSVAQLAGMSTEAFEDFYFRVCNVDYARMSAAMDPLVALMQRTKDVRIVAPGTDLRFSIAGLPAIKCDGRNNVPDGEVFTAPVRTSVNGHVAFNTPALYQGVTFENVRLEFEAGRVVRATSSDSARLAQILDTDAGARFLGEFALGVNPLVRTPMKDSLFDEKIDGSIHLALGNSYDDCDNGNESAIHWDLVLLMRPEQGGGEVRFDDRVIRRDGRFVLPELEGLNPERLA